jgi:hypothetical protein
MSDAWLQAIEQGFQVLESNPLATSATIGGMLAAGMGLRLLTGRRPHPDDRAHGSASWAADAEVRKVGLLRACLRRYHASQATDHQVDHGDADHGLTGVG